MVNLDKLRATDAIWYLSIADLDSAQYWALDCSVRFAGLVQVGIYSDDVIQQQQQQQHSLFFPSKLG